MGYEQLPPEVPMWRQDRACKNCEALNERIKVLEEDISDMFNVGPICLECQRKDERIKSLEHVLRWLDIQGGLGHEKHDKIRAVLEKK
jgi:hypothetical protein